MGAVATSRLTGWRTALELGRVSNLPTVWSNVLGATALAGGGPVGVMVMAAIAMSLLYVGGMYLNDAFDQRTDATERPSRPIPAGQASARAVFGAGFALLGVGVLLLFALRPAAGLAGLVLASAILLYDWHHKTNPLSPALMGLCRALVYVGAAAALARPDWAPVLLGAGVLFLYVTALTLASKQRWLASPAIGLLIAGIALVDALAAVSAGAVELALICVACFALTLVLQRYVSGT